MPSLHLVELSDQYPILERLQLEEALLRSEEESFCIVHVGSPRTIVMGISSDPDQLLYVDQVKKEKVLVVRRFSGGGTVIVDHNTLFITWILDKKLIDVAPFPEPILRWAASFYEKSWNISGFHLRENDYCIEEKKCGGNAQYIRKERWLLHTSFLFDYDPKNMELLTLPEKRPLYRQNRSHEEFLCRLNDFAKTPQELIESFRSALVKEFDILPFDLKNWNEKPHRKTTEIVFS